MPGSTDSASAWANGSLLRRRIDDFSFEARVVDRGDPECTGKLAKIMFVNDGRTELGVLVSECESMGSSLPVITPQPLPPAAAAVSPGALLLRRRTEFGAHLRPAESPTDAAATAQDDDAKNDDDDVVIATAATISSGKRLLPNVFMGLPQEASVNAKPWFQTLVVSAADTAFTRWAGRFSAKASRSAVAAYSTAAVARRKQTSNGGNGSSDKGASTEPGIPGGFLSAEMDDWRGRYQEVLSSERIAAEGIDLEGISQGSNGLGSTADYEGKAVGDSSYNCGNDLMSGNGRSDVSDSRKNRNELDCLVASSMLEHSLWASPGSWYSSKLALRPHSLSDYHRHFFEATPLVANAAVNVPILRRRPPPPPKVRRTPDGVNGATSNSSSSRSSSGVHRRSGLSVLNVIVNRNRSSHDASDDDLAAWHWAAAASAALDLVAMGWHPNTRVSQVNSTAGSNSTSGGSVNTNNNPSSSSKSTACNDSVETGPSLSRAAGGANTPMAKASAAAVERHEAILRATLAILATCLAQKSRRDLRNGRNRGGVSGSDADTDFTGAYDGENSKSGGSEKRQKGKKGEKSPKKMSAQELVAAAVRFGVPTKRIGGGYSVAYQDRARVQAMIWQEAATKKSNAKAAALQKKVSAVMLLQKAVRRWAAHRAQNRHWSLQDDIDGDGSSGRGSVCKGGNGGSGENGSNGSNMVSQASLDAAAVRSALAGGAFGSNSSRRNIGQNQLSSQEDSKEVPTPVLAVLPLFGCVDFINVALPALLSFCPGGTDSLAPAASPTPAVAAPTADTTAADEASNSSQRYASLDKLTTQPLPLSPHVGHVLTVLDLRGCCFGLKSSAVEAIANYAPNLHVLDLSGPGPDSEVGDADLLLLAPLAATSLRCLQLCCWQRLTSNGLIAFAEATAALHATSEAKSGDNSSSDILVHSQSSSPAGFLKGGNDSTRSSSTNEDVSSGGGALADKPPSELPPLSTFTATTKSFGTITLTQPTSPSSAPNLPQITTKSSIAPKAAELQPSSNGQSSPSSSSSSSSSAAAAAAAALSQTSLKPRLQGLNLTEAGGVVDEAVGAILRVFGDSLVDLCIHGTRSLTGTWLRHLESRHALRRLNYAGNYKMSDDLFVPLWHRARPEAVLYSNPNAFYFEVDE